MSLQEMNIATLHREERRHSFFGRAGAKAPFFDLSLKAWIISDHRQVLSLLQSPHLKVTHCAHTCQDLQEKTGCTLENQIFAFQHIPTCLNDREHRDSRRRAAAVLNERKGAIAALLPELTNDGLALLMSRSEVDLAEEVLCPLVTGFSMAIAGVRADDLSVCPTSAIFDRLLGLGKRVRLDAQIGSLRAAIEHALGTEASPEAVGIRLALFLLGQDALFGSLGVSLHRLFTSQTGLRLNEMEFPPTPTDTGVPHVERVVTEPFELDGVILQPGQRIRLMLQSLSYTDEPDDRLRFFAAGVHTCLGRPFALDLWANLIKGLSTIDRRVEILRYELRTEDYLFTCPKTFLIRLDP
jgi:hypothetical protein